MIQVMKNNMTTKKDKPAEIIPLEQFELDASNNSFIDKLDKHKKIFVDMYTRLNGHITNACAAIPISRQTYYTWLENDENFANAVAEAESHLNDEIRDVLIQKAASGDMTGVIFYLKNRHPDFKQNNPQFALQVNNFIGEKKNNYGI